MIAIITILLFCLELLYFRIADKLNIIDKPNQRSSHQSITLRGGGIIFLIGVWLHSSFYGFQYPYFLIGVSLISLISFADDVHSVPNKIRLIVHFIAMLFIFEEFGILELDKWWQMIIGLILCVGIINAYNFMDGINGITGGYSLAVFLPLIYINSQIEFIDNNFLLVCTVSVLVFCFFNFRRKAKCFAGDVGAIGIAFILLFVLGKLIILTGDFTYILFLAVYGVDSVLTIVHRVLLHENIGEAHRKHAYQLMANELKMPHILVASIYLVLQLLISLGLILWNGNAWIYFGLVIALLSIAYVLFKKKYYYLHEEYLKSKLQ